MAIDIVQDIIPVTKVRDNLSAIIDRARETKRPILVTQTGSAAVVILDAAQYQKEMEERDFLRGVLEGDADICAGPLFTTEEADAHIDAVLSKE
jgi:prevent-host-death family protein